MIIWILLVTPSLFAQIETSEQNFLESKAILREIQKENSLQRGNVDIRMGLLQISTNKPADPLKLNSRNEMPFLEFSYDGTLVKRWGISASLQHAQNTLGNGTYNTTSAYQQTYQLGFNYKRVLDETMSKNYILLKAQYYGMSNNFVLGNPQDFYIKSESGILLGIERSLPVTELFDIRGGFDFVYITAVDTESTLEYRNKGHGLQLRAEAFYNRSKASRFGLGYNISAFFNKFEDPGFQARDRHTQTYKALYLSYNRLF